jgi:hypothetical protein
MGAMFQGGGAFEPATSTFGASGELDLAGVFGLSRVTFWYHTPFFRRIEEAGALIFQANGAQDIEEGAHARKLRLLWKPIFFLDKLGARISAEPPAGTTHAPTGRAASRVVIHSRQKPGDLRAGSVTIDTETAFILSVLLPQGDGSAGEALGIEMTRFEILTDVDPSLFGARTLETPGYYYGSYYGRADEVSGRDGPPDPAAYDGGS